MREIKFRAWGKFESYDKENTMFELPFGKDMYWYEEGCINKFPKDWVIMQYTGLHDKNGKEIYEGDLITSPLIKAEFLPCLVKFGEYTDIAEAGYTSHTNIGFYIQDSTGQQTGLLNEELLIEWDSFEVIGNIYENPELVSDKK